VRDELSWAVLMAIQYVVFVRWMKPWLMHNLAPLRELAEIMALFSSFIPPAR